MTQKNRHHRRHDRQKIRAAHFRGETKQNLRRNKPVPSAVAGVLDGYGGWHTVVAQDMAAHEHPGQVLVVVPDFTVVEPIPWDTIPAIIRRVELYLVWWAETRNEPCEAATLFLLRRKRGYNQVSVNLHDIVET